MAEEVIPVPVWSTLYYSMLCMCMSVLITRFLNLQSTSFNAKEIKKYLWRDKISGSNLWQKDGDEKHLTRCHFVFLNEYHFLESDFEDDRLFVMGK